VKIAADTNVLVRLIIVDDETQHRLAIETMEAADVVAVSAHSLCELAWVLGRRYAIRAADIAAAIRRLIDTTSVVVNRPAVDAGLAVLDAGGDFADGVIAYDGQWLGAEIFVSFDRQAVRLLKSQGKAALVLE